MLRHLAAWTVCALLLGCSSGSDGAPPPSPVTVLGSPCPSGAGGLPTTTCMLLDVAPAGLIPLTVELRITEPNPDVPYLGTVVLCSGFTGVTFYGDWPSGEEFITDLTDIGLRVVDRCWTDSWLQPGIFLKENSERLAVLFDWIHANLHEGGSFFAVGTSGGAGEIGFSLTTWNREDLFDAVVLCSGPAFSRMDYLCQPPTPAWSALCPSFVPPLECGTPLCMAPEGDPICGTFIGLSEAKLLENSVLHPGAVTDFGDLPLHLIFGAEDCSEWVPQGYYFESVVTSPHSLQLVPDTDHTIFVTQQGREAIVQALLGLVPMVGESVSPSPFEIFVLEVDDAGGTAAERRFVSGTSQR
jgi:hypothetical protein